MLSLVLTHDENRDQLTKGIEVEREHKDLYDFLVGYMTKQNVKMPLTLDEFSEFIAKAHIAELSDYYDRLEKMEKE